MRLVICLTLLAIAACAPIQHEQVLSTTRPLSGVAGIGDLVARVDKERNLENIFGASDVWGRKTNEGFTELRFAGLTPAGEVVLYRTDTNIVTNETTMSRSPFSSTFSQANATTTYGGGVANTSISGTSTTIHPTTDYHAVIPAGSAQITVPKGTDAVPFEGHVVRILSATAVSLNYRVE